jgi:hypothetical protein
MALDEDLASLYQVETHVRIQAVKRNSDRFPEDFMFQLSKQEEKCLRSQIVISNISGRGGRRYLPYAFTEHDVAMLSSVQNSQHAIQMNILIIRAFIKLREMLSSHKALAIKIEELEQKDSLFLLSVRVGVFRNQMPLNFGDNHRNCRNSYPL